MSHRTVKISLLTISLVVAVVAAFPAMDALFIHGFAPACSDGYAEANGTTPCNPEWDTAAPYLVVMGLTLVGAAASAWSLAKEGAPQLR